MNNKIIKEERKKGGAAPAMLNNKIQRAKV